ncbi:SpoIIE family protein phosphatase [Streptomyces specialis]|uniref:SpoIIE family protein phosphatase n=1 Tax=Streptomyces specialis TaxID=498367 RepID=UPI000A963C74|nr:SpoIIE family protein phosphatase [Streptomyces specialis]
MTGERKKRGRQERGHGRAAAARLNMLLSLDPDRGDTDVLLAALQHVTAELGGLGGMAHLRVAGIRRSALRLVVSSGLPGGFVRPWETISDAGASAPARTIRDGGALWLPSVDVPEQVSGKPPVSPHLSGVPADCGIAAVALPGREEALGVISLLTLPAAGEPTAAQWGFLREVARWAAGRLRLTTPRPEGLSPALLDETAPPAGRETAAAPGEPAEPGEPDRAGEAEEGLWFWDWDLSTGEFEVDTRLLETLSVERDAVDWVETWADLIHPDDQPYVVHNVEESIRTHSPYAAEYRVRRADGTYAWVRSHGRVILDESGAPVRLNGTFEDTTGAHAALAPVARALRHMTDGFLAVGRDWRIEFVNATGETLLGSPGSLVGRLLWDIPVVREVPDLEERGRRAVEEGQPGGFDVRWPGTDRWYHLRLVPVPDGLTLYITDITERRLREAAQKAAAERAALVAQLTRHLAEAVTVQDVVNAVARSVLPTFGASGLVVFALENDRLNVVGITGYPPGFPDRIHGQPAAGTTPLSEALRTRTPLFIESAEAYAARYPETVDLAAAGGKQAWAFLPLSLSGRDIGGAVVSFDRPHRLEDDERTLLTALSGLIAQALERASLYEDATKRARALQRALLPRALPSLPAVTSAARYLPAGQGTEVGGDWYDVIPLSADRVALVIGDVMGHGMSEAATMGRLRTAVRTLSDLELTPEEVLAHLNDIVADLGEDRFATCLYGVYDPVDGHFCYASAGHPPPAVAHADGTVAYPELIPNPPLGVAAPPFDITATRVPDGGLLVLYTDGLVESPERDIDDGMSALAGILRTGRTTDLDALCETVTSALLPADHGTSDDAALLIARTHRLAPEDVASWPLPDDPVAAGPARDHIRAQLAARHLEDLEMTTELLASELVGNVVRHAKGPIRLRLLRSRTLICEVSDGSLTTPHIRHTSTVDEGGRGLQLVAAMAQRWGTRHTPEGKCIWTEQQIPG